MSDFKPFSYTNEKGKTYFLHQGKTNTGRLRYFMSATVKEGCLKNMPEGYSISEDVNGLVSVGKKRESLIPIADIEAVQKVAHEVLNAKHPKVKVKNDAIIVYIPINSFLESHTEKSTTPCTISFRENTIYESVMRFVFDGPSETYFADRKHYRGEGGWHPLEMDSDLVKLCYKYFKHIGKQSFFDLA